MRKSQIIKQMIYKGDLIEKTIDLLFLFLEKL